jgi:hypothetical protein
MEFTWIFHRMLLLQQLVVTGRAPAWYSVPTVLTIRFVLIREYRMAFTVLDYFNLDILAQSYRGAEHCRRCERSGSTSLLSPE